MTLNTTSIMLGERGEIVTISVTADSVGIAALHRGSLDLVVSCYHIFLLIHPVTVLG